MALIVETGAGLPDAESYSSVQEFKDYAIKYGLTYSGTATDTDIEIWLRNGTVYLDITYGPRYRGMRTKETQALAWPRDGVTDRDLFAIDNDVVPPMLKSATNEAALRSGMGELLPDITEPATISSESVSVGPVSESKSYVGGKSEVAWYRKIDGLMAPLIAQSNKLQRA